MLIFTRCSKHARGVKPSWTATEHLHDLWRSAMDESRVGLAQRSQKLGARTSIHIGAVDVGDVSANALARNHGAPLGGLQRIVIVEFLLVERVQILSMELGQLSPNDSK